MEYQVLSQDFAALRQPYRQLLAQFKSASSHEKNVRQCDWKTRKDAIDSKLGEINDDNAHGRDRGSVESKIFSWICELNKTND